MVQHASRPSIIHCGGGILISEYRWAAYALLHLATGSKSIIHFLMKCVYKEYVYVNQTLMEEAIYIPVHLPVLHLDFGSSRSN